MKKHPKNWVYKSGTKLKAQYIDETVRGHSTTTWTRKKRARGVGNKSTLVHPGAGVSLECPCGPKPTYFRKYSILFCTVMGGKKEITLH